MIAQTVSELLGWLRAVICAWRCTPSWRKRGDGTFGLFNDCYRNHRFDSFIGYFVANNSYFRGDV